MKKIRPLLLVAMPLLFVLGGINQSYAADTAASESRAEARQMKEDTTPRARYNTSRKEANAAYSEAVKACNSMSGKGKTDCLKEARTNLRDDLAQARQTLSSETGMGSSNTPSGSSSSEEAK